MDRLVLFVVACIAQVGCQSSVNGFDPFTFGRQTRVPPPPTGVVGNSGGFRASPPLPPANAGASTWPEQVGPNVEYGDGPDRYWEPAQNSQLAAPRSVAQQPPPDAPPRAAVSQRSSIPQTANRSELRQSNLRQNDRLTWRDPDSGGMSGPLPSYSEIAGQPPVGTGTSYGSSGYSPRLMPRPGPVTPIVSLPPRIGFPGGYERQPLRVPAELAEFQHRGVRQASANSPSWQSRYDDARR